MCALILICTLHRIESARRAYLENVGVKVSFVLGQTLIHASHLGQRVPESCILRLQLVEQQRELCIPAFSLEVTVSDAQRSYTTRAHGISNLQKFNEQSCLSSHPSECVRELGSLVLQQLPLNLHLMVSLSHCRQLSTLSRGSILTLLPLLLSVSKYNTRSTRKIQLGATNKKT